MKLAIISVALLALVACERVTTPPRDETSLPNSGVCASSATAGVRQFLTSHPGWQVVNTSDLTEDDQELWQNHHQGLCPGIAEVQFSPGQPATLAVTVVRDAEPGVSQWLVVLRPNDGQPPTVESLYGPDIVASPSVIWRAPSGDYVDRETGRSIHVEGDVLVFEKLEAGSLVYYRDQDAFRSLIGSE